MNGWIKGVARPERERDSKCQSGHEWSRHVCSICLYLTWTQLTSNEDWKIESLRTYERPSSSVVVVLYVHALAVRDHPKPWWFDDCCVKWLTHKLGIFFMVMVAACRPSLWRVGAGGGGGGLIFTVVPLRGPSCNSRLEWLMLTQTRRHRRSRQQQQQQHRKTG